MDWLMDRMVLWFNTDSETLLLAGFMCWLGAYLLKELFDNLLVAFAFYPVLFSVSIVSIGIGRELGLIGDWYNSLLPIILAIGIGMSFSASVLFLTIVTVHRVRD
jgi:hypothetical protein